MTSKLQSRIATASFIVAVAFSIAGFVTPPTGDLTEANLYLVAQFLLVTTSIFGVSSIVKRDAKDNIDNRSLLGGETDADE